MTEPAPTIPHARKGFNCLMTAPRYGSQVFRCVEIDEGVNISSSEDESRNSRAIYILNVNRPAFTLSLICVNRSERDRMANWLVGWAQAVSANKAVSGFIRVQVPARNFDRVAVLQGPIQFGDEVGMVTYPLRLQFIGASSPISGVGTTDVAGDSSVQAATRDTAAAPYFIPSYYVNGKTGNDAEVMYDRKVADFLQTAIKGIGDLVTGVEELFSDIFGSGP